MNLDPRGSLKHGVGVDTHGLYVCKSFICARRGPYTCEHITRTATHAGMRAAALVHPTEEDYLTRK